MSEASLRHCDVEVFYFEIRGNLETCGQQFQWLSSLARRQIDLYFANVTMPLYRLTSTLRIAVFPPLVAASALCRALSNSARLSTRWPWKPKWLPNCS